MNLSATGLPPDVVGELARHGVHTVEDYILFDISKLSLAGQGGGVAAQEVVDAVSRFLTSCFVCLPAPAVTAASSAADGTSATDGGAAASTGPPSCVAVVGRALSTGCASIDKLLRGGLRVGAVTELVGASAVGKTQVAFSAAASVASSREEARVLFVDTCGTFSAQRLSAMCRDLLKARDPKPTVQRQALSDALGRVAVFHAFDAPSLLGLVDWLALQLHTQEGACRNVRLLVIDSASAVLKPVVGVPNAQGLALMNALGHSLKFLAKLHAVAVLVCAR